MRFEGIKIHNVGPFHNVDLDLSGLDGKLIAVVGANGEGKSTLLELLPAGPYRNCPTRGSLMELATGRDSSLEVRFVNGAPYTARQWMDCVSRKGEGSILQNGEPLIASSKVRELDAWVAAHLPAPEVLYASSFLPQGSEGFLDMSGGERKAMLLRLLQIERYEAMAEAAREHARDGKIHWQNAVKQHEEALARFPKLDDAQNEMRESQSQLANARASLQQAKAHLRECDLQAGQQEQAQARLRERTALQERITSGTAQLALLRERVKNNRALMAKQAEIENAVTAGAAARQRWTELCTQRGAQEVEHAKLVLRAEDLAGKVQEAKTALQELRERAAAYATTAADAAKVERAVSELPAARTAEEEQCKLLAELDKHIAELRALSLSGKDARIAGLRVGLGEILGGTRPAKYAGEVLGSDDALAARQAHPPQDLAKREQARKTAEAKLTRVQEAKRKLEWLAARAKDVTDAKRRAAVTHQQLQELEAKLSKLEPAARQAHVAAMSAQAACAKLDHAQAVALVEAKSHEAWAALAPKLAQAAARLEELIPQEAAHARQLTADTKALAVLPVIEVPQIDRGEAEHHVTCWQQTVELANQRVAVATDTLKRAEQGVDELARRVADVTDKQVALSDWTRLAHDLGRDGLQALEIDAALPELTTLANDLLHNCHGSRFSIELRSDRLSADGRRSLEDLEVRVIDTVHGRDARAETYSGGERVIIGEALSLALTMVACRRAGLQRPTLVRDESGAALDVENGRAYVAMLRRAAQLMNADKVLFVSHSPELHGLADARIVVAGGTATLQQ